MPRCNFMFFYVFKMAVAIVFLCENAVEAVQISSISMILSLNCFYSIFTVKRNSHGHKIALITRWFNIKSCYYCYYVVFYLFWIILPWLVPTAFTVIDTKISYPKINSVNQLTLTAINTFCDWISLHTSL